MTIIEAIDKINALKPNGYSFGEKVAWLSQLDGLIYSEVIEAHEGSPALEYTEYDETTPESTELLVPHPYDELYIYFLESRIHWANEEYGKYNIAATSFENAYNNYKKHYTRTHMPKSAKKRFYF